MGKRINKVDQIANGSIYDFYFEFKTEREFFEKLGIKKEIFENGVYISFQIDVDETHYFINGTRLETDFEYTERLRKNKELEERMEKELLIRNEKKLEEEKKEYERLKKKFEGE